MGIASVSKLGGLARRSVVLLVMLTMSACSPAAGPWEKNGKFDWIPTESAPKRFPVELIEGRLILSDGSTARIPDQRTVSNGWGQWGSTHIVGAEFKAVPVKLELLWFAYTEDRFYKGSFPLPQAEMEKLFKRGVLDPISKRMEGFERVVVGMAPGGFVVVWMGSVSETVEIAAFRGEPTEVPWTRVLNNPDMSRKEFIDMIMEERVSRADRDRLAKEGVPKGLFESYRRSYRWQPWVSGAGVASLVRIETFSGEQSYITAEHGPLLPRKEWPAPRAMYIEWQAPGGPRKAAEIEFDEEEVIAGFDKLSRGDAQRQLAIQLDTTADAVTVALRDEKLILPQYKARIRVTAGR